MKKDVYLNVILTVIALCLVWICIRDISLGPPKLHANASGTSFGTQDVRIVGVKIPIYQMTDSLPVKVEGIDIDFPPIQFVHVTNWPDK